MKLLLLHGPASNNSRSKLSQIREKFDVGNIVVYESGSDIQTILGNLATGSLLAGDQLFILENPPEDFTNYPLIPVTCTLILWFDHEITEKKPVMDWVKKSKGEILFFTEGKEASIFPFLDYLANCDRKAFLELEKSDFDIHYVFTMVYYLLRNLITTTKNAHPYVKQKLETQRKNFSKEKIIDLYKEILELDFQLKSGLIEKKHAQFLLIENFLKT